MAEVDPVRLAKAVVHRKLCWPTDNDDDDGKLVSAVKDGRLEIIRALLHRGAHTEHVDEMGLTPLLAATRAGNMAAIEALLDAGADINSYGHTTWTALHFAAHLGDSATIEALVTRGGNLAARTALKGKSPLHIAAGHAETRAVQDLVLRWGADETQLDGRGRSASDTAGALKNVFERGPRHAEKVERIKVLLANAPRDRRWIRRRAVVMLVSRIRGEIAAERERSSSSSSNSSSRAKGKESTGGAKKRGGGGATAGATAGATVGATAGATAVGAEGAAGPAGQQQAGQLTASVAAAAAAAAASAAAAEEQEALWWDVMRRSASAAAAGEQQQQQASSLPHGMEAFRDAVVRLGGEDDVGIFRSVVGFL